MSSRLQDADSLDSRDEAKKEGAFYVWTQKVSLLELMLL